VRIGVLSIGVLLFAAACGDARPAAVDDSVGDAFVFVTADPADPTKTQLLGRMDAAHAAHALDTGLASAWSPCVTHDAMRLCFLGRSTPEGPAALYVAGIDGADAVACAAPVDEHSAPAWLPGGRIVFAAPAPDGSRALFVFDPPAGEPKRITFCGTDVTAPTVLKDGRILYVGTSFERVPAGAPALFTVHPDGSGVTLFHARTQAERYARPRQARNGDVAFLALGPSARVCTIDWRAPQADSTALAVPPGTVAVEALSGGAWIALARPAGNVPAQLTRLPADGASRAADPRALRTLVDLCTADVRPRPQGHLSMVREEAERGRVLCLDARPEGSGRRGVSVRLHVRTGAAGETTWRTLGDVTLAADGSFFVDVPADVPLRLDVLDADGAVLSATRTPFWVRPNEVRGCVGCHAPSDATPPNRMPLAGLNDPLELAISTEMGAVR